MLRDRPQECRAPWFHFVVAWFLPSYGMIGSIVSTHETRWSNALVLYGSLRHAYESRKNAWHQWNASVWTTARRKEFFVDACTLVASLFLRADEESRVSSAPRSAPIWVIHAVRILPQTLGRTAWQRFFDNNTKELHSSNKVRWLVDQLFLC